MIKQYLLRILPYLVLSAFTFGCSSAVLDDYEDQIRSKEKEKTIIQYDNSIVYCVKNISRWMTQVQGGKSCQGADCYRNLLCQFRVDHTALDIMDMEKKCHVATIVLPPLGSAFHCNNADFSNTFYKDTDEFPLLYSSQQGKGVRCILVDRIYKEGEDYQLETIQRIDIPYEIDVPLQYSPDAIVDKENNYLYVYTGGTIPATDFYVYKFRMPSFTEGNVRLTEKDILSEWVIRGNPAYYKQGGMIKDDVLYIMEGVPRWGTDNILRIINLNQNSFSLINLSELTNVKWESEDIFWYDNSLFIASNNSGIYRLEIEENATSVINILEN